MAWILGVHSSRLLEYRDDRILTDTGCIRGDGRGQGVGQSEALHQKRNRTWTKRRKSRGGESTLQIADMPEG